MGSLDVQWIHGSPNCNNNTDPPIQIHRYDENSFIMRQSKCVDREYSFEAPFMYLLFGDDSVMLLDTGATSSPHLFPIGATVRGIISNWLAERSQQSIPLLICHSHAHGDHTRGDDQFIHQNDVTIIPPTLSGTKQFFGFVHWPEQLATVELGKRTLDVIPIPGHENSHLAFYDRVTKLLFSGDTLYPGLLVVRDWEAYRKSIERLKSFAGNHEVSFILGAHIEMKSTPFKWFGYPQWFQPDEHILQLESQHLLELHNALINLPSPSVDRHEDFIIQSANLPVPPSDT
jgi:hydroxyacylglutathione hydrolase